MRKKHCKRWTKEEKQIVSAFTKNFAPKLTTSKKQNALIILNDPTIKELAKGLERGDGAAMIKVAICSYNLGYPIRKWGAWKL
jgi:hypothetical protein